MVDTNLSPCLVFVQLFNSWRPLMFHYIAGGILSCELCMMTCNNEEQLEMHFQVRRFMDIKCSYLNNLFFRVRGINQSFWEFKQVRFNFNVPFAISAPPVRAASLNISRSIEWVVQFCPKNKWHSVLCLLEKNCLYTAHWFLALCWHKQQKTTQTKFRIQKASH